MLCATEGTSAYLNENGIPCEKMTDSEEIEAVKRGEVALMINTPTRGKLPERDGFLLRRTSIEYNVPSITNLDTADAVISVIGYFTGKDECGVYPLDDYSNYDEGGME